MLAGTAYGVILNDRPEREAFGSAFEREPYRRPPEAPVLYIKPRGCFAPSGSDVLVAPGAEISVAATIGLLFAQPTTRADRAGALAGIGGACLALDLSEPHDSYYRPAIRERCGDGFLPLGGFAPFSPVLAECAITTRIDGEVVHRWSLERLVRDIAALIVDVTDFMTLSPGDLLLVGLPGDAPIARAGQTVEAAIEGLPALRTRLVGEVAA